MWYNLIIGGDVMIDGLMFHDMEFKNIIVMKNTFEENQVINYMNCGRDGHLLHLVLSGGRRYEVNNRVFEVEKGEVIFIPDKTEYITKSVKRNGETCSGIGIIFDITDIPDNIIKKNVYHKYNDTGNEISEIFENMELAHREVPIPVFKLKTMLYQLFYNLFNPEADSPVKPAIDYITKHYNENLPVKEYADACNLSESYFRKIFNDFTGMSPIEFRNSIRFKEAKKLYRQNLSTVEIAERTGFCDENYFSKMYKRYNGASLKENSRFI